MATDSLPPGWQKVTRVFRATAFAPIITIRENCIAISADFAKLADIERATRVSFFLIDGGVAFAMQFHNRDEQDAFRVVRDGGSGRLHAARLIYMPAELRSCARVRVLAKSGRRARRIVPSREGNFWLVRLVPCFENTNQAGLTETETGIYRYTLGGETVCIGRGALLARIREHAKSNWTFDQISFSVLNDGDAERHWESFWLNEYRGQHGRWPIYNRIGGIILSDEELSNGPCRGSAAGS